MRAFICCLFLTLISGFYLTAMDIPVDGQLPPPPPQWVAKEIFNGRVTDQQIDEVDCNAFVQELQDRENFTGAGWVMTYVDVLVGQGILTLANNHPGITLTLVLGQEAALRRYLREQSAIARSLREQLEGGDE